MARHFEEVAEVSWLLRHRVRAVAFDVHGFVLIGVATEKAPVVNSCVSALVTAILRADGSEWIMHTCRQAHIRRSEKLGREREKDASSLCPAPYSHRIIMGSVVTTH